MTDTEKAARALVERTTKAQGLPTTITDETTLRHVAAAMRCHKVRKAA